MLLILGWFPCASRFELRSVAGTVIDRRGNALPDAVVQLENTGTLWVVSYITGKDGRYHFTGLRDDIDFTLKAKYRNLWSKQRTLSQFDSCKHFEVKLVIPTE
ncbi:MAG TPA: carboxypeptidase-like regulatory domain-containing protein [Bryobacteraceae bacterium]|nr:carboxypeptidase-like regulatory domain-containing protein [Bryobacteraceae bacterium]